MARSIGVAAGMSSISVNGASFEKSPEVSGIAVVAARLPST